MTRTCDDVSPIERKSVNSHLYTFSGFIRDATGGYEGVFYAASISSIVCSFACFLLMLIDYIYKRKKKTNFHRKGISIISQL
jgi:hypothetical protein